MITIIYSAEPEMARRTAMKFLKADYPQRDECNFVSFNMAVSSLKEVAEECEFMALGVEKKAVLAENCAFLAKTPRGKKAPKVEGAEALLAYCERPIETTDLYLVVYSDSLDEKNPIVAAIKKNGQIKEIPVPDKKEWVVYAQRYLNNHNAPIDSYAANELVARVDGDYGRFLNELTKLACYSGGQTIKKSDIEVLVAPKLEEDAFAMSNALTRGDNAAAIRIYKDLKVFSVDEIRLINMLAQQFKFMDQVRFLDDKGLPSRAIAEELGCKPARVDITLRNLYSCKSDTIPNLMEELYEASRSILSGEAQPGFVFKRFLANYHL